MVLVTISFSYAAVDSVGNYRFCCIGPPVGCLRLRHAQAQHLTPDEDGLRDHLFSSSFANDQEASTSEKVKSRTRTGTRDQTVNWHLSRCSLDGVGDHRLSTSERFHTTSSDKQTKTAETSKLKTAETSKLMVTNTIQAATLKMPVDGLIPRARSCSYC